MRRIRTLSESVANRIAAGEVIERPASAVKELVENSLDAGATRVAVELEEGGAGLIRVSDDGMGMGREDAEECFGRHATSKLPEGAEAGGLFLVRSFGFRGEAVPSIAAVSRFTLLTRERGAVGGTRVRVEAGKLALVEDAAAPEGTVAEVRDLFYNVPARRKFLKRTATESAHAEEAVGRLALAHPGVAFELTLDGRRALSAPATSDGRERVAAVLGREAFEHLMTVADGVGDVRVQGFAAGPDLSQSSAKQIYTFVNGRFVRDRTLISAVTRAYADVLPHGRYPVVVLFVTLPEDRVDVNVHPQKMEVRFADGKSAFDAVYRSLGGALRGGGWLGEQGPSMILGGGPLPQNDSITSLRHSADPSHPDALRDHSAPYTATNVPPWFNRRPGSHSHDQPALLAPATDFFLSLRYLGQLHKTYLVCEAPGSLVLIDQHAAHERVAFEKLRRAAQVQGPRGQSLLFPARIELAAAQAEALAAHQDLVSEMGFEIEPFDGENAIAVRAVPALLLKAEIARVLSDLADELSDADRAGRAVRDAFTDALARIACHAAVRAQDVLLPEEARSLLDDLAGTDYGTRCPHGRPVVVQLGTPELERRFGRDYRF